MITADFCHHYLDFSGDGIVVRLPCGIAIDLLRYWERESKLHLYSSPASSVKAGMPASFPSPKARERGLGQLNVLLYMEQLMQSAGEAVHELVVFADTKVADGTMSRTRFIYPGARRLRKWGSSMFRRAAIRI